MKYTFLTKYKNVIPCLQKHLNKKLVTKVAVYQYRNYSIHLQTASITTCLCALVHSQCYQRLNSSNNASIVIFLEKCNFIIVNTMNNSFCPHCNKPFIIMPLHKSVTLKSPQNNWGAILRPQLLPDFTFTKKCAYSPDSNVTLSNNGQYLFWI